MDYQNNIYGKIYNYEKSIKPAPNPFYTLDKYHGNLSINEYRKLLFDDRKIYIPLDKNNLISVNIESKEILVNPIKGVLN